MSGVTPWLRRPYSTGCAARCGELTVLHGSQRVSSVPAPRAHRSGSHACSRRARGEDLEVVVPTNATRLHRRTLTRATALAVMALWAFTAGPLIAQPPQPDPSARSRCSSVNGPSKARAEPF